MNISITKPQDCGPIDPVTPLPKKNIQFILPVKEKESSNNMGVLSPETSHQSSSYITRSSRHPRRPCSLSADGQTEYTSHPKSPSAPKARKMEHMSGFDPYQVFEVNHLPCMILTVRVLEGRNITSGWAQDLVDTPDPYIQLRVRNAPNGRQRTQTIDNNTNPVWNETLTFLLDFREKNVLQIDLMEANYLYDQIMGTVYFDTCKLEISEWHRETFMFNEVSEVLIEIKLEWDKNPTLRYSLCLCEGEKAFREQRKSKTFEGLRRLLGERGPKSNGEVPNIAVIGSGGGFRAMTSFSGVFKALINSGVLDCTTYVGGLSGSSWFLSTLFSHPKWPNVDPDDIFEELKKNVDSSILWLLKPQSVYRYLDRIMTKKKTGQPVSFTDFFGHMVGETLLRGRLETKLTDQRSKIEGGETPMPLYTCVHVKKDVPARSFQEWVEFSPYEIGFPKYGTFMDSKLFGSKFFMGKLCSKNEEVPLHFLQGIWGSAFCILFKRLLDDNRKLDPTEMIRQELGKELERTQQEELSDSNDESGTDDDDSEDTPSQDTTSAAAQNNKTETQTNGEDLKLQSRNSTKKQHHKPQINCGEPVPEELKVKSKRVSFVQGPIQDKAESDEPEDSQEKKIKIQRKVSTRKTHKKSYWKGVLEGIFENKNFELLSTRAGRAAVIHNFMRGLSLQQSYPLSPFTPVSQRFPEDGDDEFDGIFEMHPTNIKHIYMVDAGLTFNSPFPLMLRPQRGVDIILSFDFSARPDDCTPPFKELLLAEKWAKLNRIPFPPIDSSIVDREGLKELYIFKHPTDVQCPIVLHFPLVNIAFRQYSAPGVERKTDEEKEFANFDLFDDPSTPYSTFNFKYSHLQFERLAKLTEFNTLLHIQDIKDCFAECIERKRSKPQRQSINAKSFKLIRMQSIKERKKLKNFVERVDSSVRRKSATFMDAPVEDDSSSSDTNSLLRRRGASRHIPLHSLNSITESISLESPEDRKRKCGFWPKPTNYIDEQLSDDEDDANADVWYDAICNSEDDEDYEIPILT